MRSVFSTAGLVLSIFCISSITLSVFFNEVDGGVEHVTKMVPVSSSGTRPVFVVVAPKASTTIPIITDATAIHFLFTITSTPCWYLSCKRWYAALKLVKKRCVKFCLCSPECGFSSTAQSAGDSVNALIADITMDTAMVSPNSR